MNDPVDHVTPCVQKKKKHRHIISRLCRQPHYFFAHKGKAQYHNPDMQLMEVGHPLRHLDSRRVLACSPATHWSMGGEGYLSYGKGF